jgi:carboxyl-terminal processing protease
LAEIHENSLQRVPDRDLFDGAMRGMVSVLNERGDQHSQFLDEEETVQLSGDIRQQFGGIGVRIGFEGEPPRLTIVGPPEPGSPAAREDLRAGDRISRVDERPTDSMTMGDVLKLMRGVPGTGVRLMIERGDEDPRNVELVREIINIESVLGDRRGADGGWRFLLDSDPRIAHVRIASFGERTAGELQRVLAHVMARGAKAVALDLRDDAGGSLDAAVAVCEMFLPAGRKIVETRGRDGTVQKSYATSADGQYLDVPLVVLVNQDSASASEIVAACLQDHHRAAVAGQRSYGKGTVQQLIPMQNGKSNLKLTWASFWRPSNAKIDRSAGEAESAVWGVIPDKGLERRLNDEQSARFREYRGARDRMGLTTTDQAAKKGDDSAPPFVDEQLQLAVKYLQGKIGRETR